MPFATTKTPEQLAAEKKAKMGAFVDKAIALLLRLCKMRGVPAPLKEHILNEVIPDLTNISAAVKQ